MALYCTIGNLPPPTAATLGFVETSVIFTSPSSSSDEDESFESSSLEDESSSPLDSAFFVGADFTGTALAAFGGPSSESESESLEQGDSTLEGFVVSLSDSDSEDSDESEEDGAFLRTDFERMGGGTGFASSSESESEDSDSDCFLGGGGFFFWPSLAVSSSDSSDESESSSDDSCFEGRGALPATLDTSLGLGTSLGAGFSSSLSLSSDSGVASFAKAFTCATLGFSSSSEELSLLSSEEDFLEGLD